MTNALVFISLLPQQLRIMEQQLAESPWNALAMASEAPNGSPQQQPTSPAANGSAKDALQRIESPSDEQRKIRLNDAKLVEAKAAKIKEWVMNKLREVTCFLLTDYPSLARPQSPRRTADNR